MSEQALAWLWLGNTPALKERRAGGFIRFHVLPVSHTHSSLVLQPLEVNCSKNPALAHTGRPPHSELQTNVKIRKVTLGVGNPI